MPLPRPQRGRPKGSGINDTPRLREIASLMASNPQMRPTTAIRMLGETDPSVVRRLRDKFYAMQAELMREVRGGVPGHELSHPTTVAAAARSEPAPVRVLSLVAPDPTRRAEPPAPIVQTEHLVARTLTSERPATEVGQMTRERLAELAAQNVMVSLAIQASIIAHPQTTTGNRDGARLQAMAALLRQQIELGERLMATAWPRSDRSPLNA